MAPATRLQFHFLLTSVGLLHDFFFIYAINIYIYICYCNLLIHHQQKPAALPGMDNCETMPLDVGDGPPSSGAIGSGPPQNEEPKGTQDLGTTEIDVEISTGKVTFTPATTTSDDTGLQQQQAETKQTTQPVQTPAELPKVEHADPHAPETSKVDVPKAPNPPHKEGEKVPPGWGNAKYISPAEQQRATPKAKAKASNARGKSKAKPKQVEKETKKRGRSRAESASAAKGSKKGRQGSTEKEPKDSKRKNKTNEDPPEKSRKVDLSAKEALRSKKCCAYQKVLARLRRDGVAEDEAKKQAKLVPRTQ